MKKKALATVISAIMVVAFIPTFSFAAEDTSFEEDVNVELETDVSEDLDAEEVAEVVENIAATDDVIEDVDEEDGCFVVDEEDAEIIVSDDEVVLDGGEADEQISMSLPEEFNHMEGTLAGDGTIVYAEEETDAALAVQAVQEHQDDICLDGFRSLVIIDNAQAPHDYSFQFDLPEGAKLVQDGDYINIINENNMVTDENGENPEPEFLGVIEPAWAKDANGESIRTEYRINGNTIIQTIEFNENSAFPIVADPTTKKPKSTKIGTYTNSYKLSHAAVGLGITSGGALTKAAKKKLAKKLADKVGGKFVPIVSWLTVAVDLYCGYASLKKHDYTKFTLKYEVWTMYKHEGGKWVEGYKVKVKKISATWSD